MVRAYIWDLDGTLFDSYTVIVDTLVEICAECGYDISRTEISREVIRTSVNSFITNLSEKTGVPVSEYEERYAVTSRAKTENIQAMPHAKEALVRLSEIGCENYVYTHRGTTSEGVLKKLGLYECFKDIVTALDNFPRKPAPDALLHLIEKHALDPAETFYVGDRTIDMDCAKNAGIRGILYKPENSFCVPNGSEARIVSDLLEIAEM